MMALNQVFKALSDPTRREILRLLGHGERTAGELSASFDMTKPSMSHHFAVLKEADLISQPPRRAADLLLAEHHGPGRRDDADLGPLRRRGTRKETWSHEPALLDHRDRPDRSRRGGSRPGSTRACRTASPPTGTSRVRSTATATSPGRCSSFPAMMIAFLVLFAFLPVLSRRSTSRSTRSARRTSISWCSLSALFALHARGHPAGDVAGSPAGPKFMDIGRALIGGMFLFFALMGNVMGKVRKNFYIGIRVPWTLASDRVWNDTHRLAAWLMVGGGIVGFLLVIAGLPIVWPIGVMIVTFLVPVVYSFVHYKALERQGAL